MNVKLNMQRGYFQEQHHPRIRDGESVILVTLTKFDAVIKPVCEPFPLVMNSDYSINPEEKVKTKQLLAG